jgi:ABC-type dipeptide/oligopeptide/nickel transport system ATPase component
MIALALLGRTELLLADEPTTALVVSVQRQIANLLAGVNEERGISVVLVSHDIALVSEIRDRINVMRNGWVLAQGTTEEVLTDPRHPYTRALLGGAAQTLTAVSSGQPADRQTRSLA